MASTKLQVNTEVLCSAQYRKALPNHLITVHEEWWIVKTFGKEEVKQEVLVTKDIIYKDYII